MSTVSGRLRLWVWGILVLAVLFAGCGAAGSADDDPDRDPYGVDTPNWSTPTDPADAPDESDELLPGLTNETVTSSWALLDAHADALSNRSYVYEHTTTETNENGTVVHEASDSITADAAGQVFAYAGGAEAWGTEDEVLIRSAAENESPDVEPYYERELPDKYRFTGFHTLEHGLTAMENVTVTVEDGDDSTRYVLESTESPPYGYTNASLRMVVDETGYVESYRFEYEREGGSGPLTVVSEVTVERVGDSSITVEPPEWLPEANEYFDTRDNASSDE